MLSCSFLAKQREGGRPDNLEKTSFPETAPRVQVSPLGNPGSPPVPASLMLTPLKHPAIGSQTDEVPTGHRGGRGEDQGDGTRQKEGERC